MLSAQQPKAVKQASVPVPALTPSLQTGHAVKTGKLAKVLPLATVVQPQDSVGKVLITVVPVVNPHSAPVIQDQGLFPQMGVVARMERPVKVLSRETAVPPLGSVVLVRISAMPDARLLLGLVRVLFPLMVRAGKMGRHVVARRLEIGNYDPSRNPSSQLSLILNSCSSSGFCGKTSAFCDAGCQPSFGTCSAISSSISTDGVCGNKNGKTCVGSTFGNCCSSSGSCGGSTAHCGVGYQKGSSSACLTSNIPTVDGSCGPNSGGLTCAGGDFNGQCCSASGYCGTTSGHCGAGCLKGFGRCN